MRRTTFRAMAATAAGLTLAATAATAQAAGPAPDDDVVGADRYPAGLLRAMQDDLGVSPERAVERLGFQDAAAAAQDRLRERLGDDFAGAWLDPRHDRLYVATTGDDDAAVRAAGASAVDARYSLDQLEGWSADLADGLGDAAGRAVTGWHVDVRDNALVVETLAGAAPAARAALDDALAAADVPGSAVTVATTAERPRLLDDIVGGNAYYIGSGARCSVGFAVTDGFVTAGHCGSAGDTTSQPAGTFAGSSFPGDDYGYVQVGLDSTPVGAVNDWAGGQVAVAGAEPAPVGAQVCRSGSTTGWHCGTVEALDVSVSYAEGTVDGLIRADVCAEPGDSGGSLLAGDQAQGVTSGGSGDCTSGGTTFFQPVGEILDAYGLTLVTDGA
ncbi:S1 family peptidase [Krasilnikoviella flava]|uniref:Streptogrisin C n=1 Tax=Krasilnikoviella flava TaxID=526729 RepID=A0A1T5LGA8_9MICO|nr:S1 family peptidase [Krasilnikoviella flava]SKC75000.1 streptogrisin C [Krasilnikoviella flava]